MFDPFQRSPELREKIGLDALKRAKQAAANWESLALDNRTIKSIEREARVREALAFDQFEKDLTQERMTASDYEALSLEDEALFKNQPIIRTILDGYGRFMSRTEAIKTGRLFSDGVKGGDYDGAPTLPGWMYGGTAMPDEIAQFLYESGYLQDAYVDTMWEAIATAMTTSDKIKEAQRNARRKLRDIKQTARAKASQEAEKWKREALNNSVSSMAKRDRLVASIRTLDAIRAALPPEVRGKVGGYARLAELSTDETRLSWIESRVKRIDTLLENYLKKEADRKLKKLFKIAKPAKDEAGKKKVGKAGHDVHALFDEEPVYLEKGRTVYSAKIKVWHEQKSAWVWKKVSTGAANKVDAVSIANALMKGSEDAQDGSMNREAWSHFL